MRVFHDIFDKIISIENLISSWKEFRIGKKNRPDTLEFERNLEDNIWQLHDELRDKTYKHSPYISFYIHDPKLRHIHKAYVRDRVLHHAIVKHLDPIFEPGFIFDSYSCRINKGTHRGISRFVSQTRKISLNFNQPAWILKCDVKKFFASIDQNVLLNILFRHVHDPDTQWLLREVVSGFKSEFTIDPNQPKGVPIGNLTSQLFANVYLNELDQFMKHDLREEHYLRYADDFVVIHAQRDHLIGIVDRINYFLNNHLKLVLHPNKIHIRKINQGVDFLGYICFPHFLIPRVKTEKRIFNKMRYKAKQFNSGRLSWESFNHALQSYLGVLSHSNSFELKENLLNHTFFWLNE